MKTVLQDEKTNKTLEIRERTRANGTPCIEIIIIDNEDNTSKSFIINKDKISKIISIF